MQKEKTLSVIPRLPERRSRAGEARNLAVASGQRIFPAHKPDSSLRPDKEHRDFVQNDNDLVSAEAFFKTSIIILLLVSLLSGCAGQRPPEGGPVDSIPPEIISVYPTPQTTRFSDSKVVLEFSEYVDRRSVEEAIFISPSIEKKEFDWSGTEVEINFLEELKKNTTYVLTVGTDVRDVRAGNRMANSFSLSFSTGEKIDNCMITGKVYDEKPDGVMLFSYRLNNINADTLNPMMTKPDYITQTGKGGDFRLTNLAPGTYRLFAVRDEFRNLLYDPETDAVGTTDDMTLTESDTLKQGVKFIVAKEDTTAPRINSVQATDNRHVIVTFSEPLDTSTITLSAFNISDTVRQKFLTIQDVYPNGFQFNSFTLVTEQQQPDSIYLLTVLNTVKDQSGFRISPLAQSKLFTGSAVRDTLPPSLISSTLTAPSAKIFAGDSILIVFSDAVQRPVSDSAFSLLRKKDSVAISYRRSWLNATALYIKPLSLLQIGEEYSLNIRWNFISDKSGNARKDSTTTFQCSIDDPENYGSIEGSFAGFGGGTVVIQAQNITDKKQLPKKVKATQYGKFSLPLLPEGRYVLKAFDDVNKNDNHEAGSPFPFIRAERFSFYPDTIRVRPRWPVDGVMFKER
jgi:hypothetical protein